MLQKHKIDIAILNMITAKYYLHFLGIKDLKINNKSKYNLDLKIALKKDLGDIPLSIIDKGLASISKQEFNNIFDKWTNVNVKQRTNWRLIIQMIVVLFLIMLLMVFYNYKLNKKVQEKTKKIRNLLYDFDKNVMIVKTDEEGVIIYVSKAFCDISGYTKEELIEKNYSIVLAPSIKEELLKEIINNIKLKKSWKGEIQQIKKNGEIFCAKFYGEFISDEKILWVINDITKEKEIQKKLESEKKLISSIMNSQDSIVITTDNVKITTANDTFYKFFNVSTLEEFNKEYGHCICDTFEEVDNDEYLTKEINGISCIDYVLLNQDKSFKAKINSSTFNISIDSFEFENKRFITVVLNDITELENVKKNIELLHKHTKESIEFAAFLQSALLPENTLINKFFKNTFILW